MSYTLRGRLESRLAAAAPALLAALAVHTWWAIELVALMLALGIALDVLLYHRALPYQPGWAALPLGALELGLLYVLMRAIPIHAPVGAALLLFAVGWVSQQVFGHAIFPRFRLTYAERGGELGRWGVATAAAVVVVLAAGVAAGYATRPPTIRLRGVVQGPLRIDSPRTIVGGVVRGGIVIRSDDVTLRDVQVVGGEYGIDVDGADDVLLEDVSVVAAELDAIHIRLSEVMIDGCHISSPASEWVQGIDLSFAAPGQMSTIENCTIGGVREGIVTHMAMVDIEGNTVADATFRGIVMGEMSMGAIRDNDVTGALGVGIYCVDYSECKIEDNTVTRTLVDPGGDPMRAGVAIEAQYFARAELDGNVVAASPGGIRAYGGATITRR